MLSLQREPKSAHGKSHRLTQQVTAVPASLREDSGDCAIVGRAGGASKISGWDATPNSHAGRPLSPQLGSLVAYSEAALISKEWLVQPRSKSL